MLASSTALRYSKRLVRSLFVMIIFVWVNDGMATNEQMFPQENGFHDFQFTSSVGEMDVSLFLPPTINGNTPLILVLHYAGQPSRYYGRPLLENLLVPAFADTKEMPPAIFVAPTSVGGDWQAKNNVIAVFEIFKALENHYGTNLSRRVVTGYSMGAVGSWHMQSENPGFFSAAIPIAGYPMRSSVTCNSPIYAIMSNADEIFAVAPFEELIATLKEQKTPIFAEIIEGAGHYDIGGFQGAVGNAARWLSKQW